MGGSSKKVTTGYRYYMGLHFGICHGPIDSMGEIRVGDRVAWDGDANDGGGNNVTISAPVLFGGDEKEGGIVGSGTIMPGDEAQTANSYLVSKLGSLMPAFRGILGFVFNGQVSANNPYVKPWAFKLTRIISGGAEQEWQQDLATIRTSNTGNYYYEPAKFQLITYGSWSAVGGAPASTDPYFDSFFEALDYLINWKSGPGALNGPDSETKRGYIFGANIDGAGTDTVTWRDGGTGTARFAIGYIGDRGWSSSSSITEVDYVSTKGRFEAEPYWFTRGGMMNPAHIIYQCLANTSWGMGWPIANIDDAAFTAAAQTLYDESFGMSLIWNQQSKIGDFIQTVLDHIGAVLYADPTTGKFVLKLIRGDYDVGTLDEYDETNIVRLEDFQRVAFGETVNEITVVYTDNDTDKPASITVQDLANIQAQGAVVAQTRQYPGIRTFEIASRVADRDLMAASLPLAKGTMKVNRTAWSLMPGGVFKLSWPKLGITTLVCRVLAVEQGTLTDGTITVSFAEDVFGLPNSSYVSEQPSGWEDTSAEPPVPIVDRVVTEASYYELLQRMGPADLALLADDAGYLSVAAARPATNSVDFGAIVDEGSGYPSEATTTGDFCASGTIDANLSHTATSVTLENLSDASLVLTGTYAQIDDEIVRIDAFDSTTGAATIGRGVLDTVAAAHTAGATMLFIDGYTSSDEIERIDAEVIDVKLLTRAGGAELAEADATADTVTFDQRQFRPYPPGQFEINGTAYPADLTEPSDITITWAHRDRLQQNLEGDETGDIGPEAGTTYSLAITNVDTSVEVYSTTGLTGTSHLVASPLYGDYTMRIELWSVRDALNSRQRHSYEFPYVRTEITDPSFASVELLLGCEGADGSTTFNDESGAGNNMTANGNAQVDTAQFKYGTAALLLDGTGDYLSRADDADFGFGTGDFTVECWLRRDSGTSGDYPLFDFRASGSQNGMFYLSPTNRRLTYYNGSTFGNTGSAPSASTWAHIAFCRSGSTLYAFLDGVQQWTATMSGDFGASRPLRIGGNFAASAFANGHMDEIRVTKGVARYTTNFTPPAAAFPRS